MPVKGSLGEEIEVLDFQYYSADVTSFLKRPLY